MPSLPPFASRTLFAPQLITCHPYTYNKHRKFNASLSNYKLNSKLVLYMNDCDKFEPKVPDAALFQSGNLLFLLVRILILECSQCIHDTNIAFM